MLHIYYNLLFPNDIDMSVTTMFLSTASDLLFRLISGETKASTEDISSVHSELSHSRPSAKSLSPSTCSPGPSKPNFGFLDLPYELRRMIYAHLMEPTSKRNLSLDDGPKWSILTFGFCAALLACNKRINAEAKEIFYRKNVLVVPFSSASDKYGYGSSQFRDIADFIMDNMRPGARYRTFLSSLTTVEVVLSIGSWDWNQDYAREAALYHGVPEEELSATMSKIPLPIVKLLERMEFGPMCLDLVGLPAVNQIRFVWGSAKDNTADNESERELKTYFMPGPRNHLSSNLRQIRNSATIHVQRKSCAPNPGPKLPYELIDVSALSYPEISRTNLGPWDDDFDERLRSQTLSLFGQTMTEKKEETMGLLYDRSQIPIHLWARQTLYYKLS